MDVQHNPIGAGRTRFLRHIGAAAVLIFTAFAFGGCAVGAGYDTGYYAPSYAGYYADYGYTGGPYWGRGPYVGSTIVVSGRTHRGYYGRHHYSHDWRHHRRDWRHRGRH
jgi:hypothetical protein